MIRRPWPSRAVRCAAPINNTDRAQMADWTALDRLPAASQFPNAADLAELRFVAQRTKRGKR